MAEHDGWCLKNTKARVPYFLLGFFAPLRRAVINLIDLRVRGGYEEWIKSEKGEGYEIVKVKLVEVDDEKR